MAHAITGTRHGGRAPGDRIGIADVAAAYGVEAVQRRLDQLRATGQWFAVQAIEQELAAAGLGAPPAELRDSA
ncbi:hypothetical protein [Nocardia sp. alder85J]|uniref:hypothetical protein n=1 Tax=Nocardia sp. alder85J TaxID=2862949 RepID=UPI001CD4C24A|nr:hypothetical protein [Nocardia sp. alder85J]MCX4093241.1 hypothetical protein [Nocardia sp. alder85J]